MSNQPISQISRKKTVIVTVHGIGFQQPPEDGRPGYADGLHANLAAELDGRLGGDPRRGQGPVYVLSAKPGTRDREWGLSRLGTFPSGGGPIDISKAPLTAGSDENIAHVAVVYVPLEDIGPGLLGGVATLGDAGLALHKYTSLPGLLHLAFGDFLASLRKHAAAGHKTAGAAEGGDAPWLRPRGDVRHRAAGPEPEDKDEKHESTGHPDGLAGVVQTLENDVVGYVDRNDLREPIRAFVAEVLHRLTERPDVERVVVNAHSQGTVIAFDVLRHYPAKPKSKIATLVTAGSPLRKYADMLSWGRDAGGIQSIKWLNFWDEKDPVADPLDPPPNWKFGDPPVRKPGELGLLWATDGEGKQIEITIHDTLVDNCANSSGGGLRAHNYWNNRAEFISALVKTVDNPAG